VHGVGLGGEEATRAADLVVGDDVALLLREHAALAARARDHAVDRLVEIGHVHRVLALGAASKAASFIRVGEVGTRMPGVRAASTRSSTLERG